MTQLARSDWHQALRQCSGWYDECIPSECQCPSPAESSSLPVDQGFLSGTAEWGWCNSTESGSCFGFNRKWTICQTSAHFLTWYWLKTDHAHCKIEVTVRSYFRRSPGPGEFGGKILLFFFFFRGTRCLISVSQLVPLCRIYRSVLADWIRITLSFTDLK